jgi:hypothetical protein
MKTAPSPFPDDDRCETCVQPMSITRRLGELRNAAPEAVSRAARIIVDNPGQMAVMAAACIVAAQVAGNVMRPRTAVQAVALAIVLQVGMGKLAAAAVERGWLEFKIRDDDGHLVPFRDL